MCERITESFDIKISKPCFFFYVQLYGTPNFVEVLLQILLEVLIPKAR